LNKKFTYDEVKEFQNHEENYMHYMVSFFYILILWQRIFPRGWSI